MLRTEKCRIIENEKIGQDFFRLKIVAPLIAGRARPGQFVHLRYSGAEGILLRRPFSVHNAAKSTKVASGQWSVKAKKEKKWIEIIYRIVGKGTKILAEMKPGQIIDALGPAGNGFAVHAGLKNAIIVAGGMGVVPLVFLAEQLKAQSSKLKVRILRGAKTKKELLCEKEFRKLGCEVKVSTDDGSRGHKGLVTDLLNCLLTTHHSPLTTVVYACGPKPMLKKVAQIAGKYNIKAQVSLEEDMACGIGACYGCSVDTKQGYKLVCKDGPVFDAGVIIWDQQG